MALSIESKLGKSETPLKMYFIKNKNSSSLILIINGLLSASRIVYWSLVDAQGASVQKYPPQPLHVGQDNEVVVPIFAIADGDLTLHITDAGDSTNTGTFTINSKQINKFSLQTKTLPPLYTGQAVTFLSTIEGIDDKPAAAEIYWWKQSSGEHDPESSVEVEPMLTDPTDPKSFEKSFIFEQTDLDLMGRGAVFAKLGVYGNIESLSPQFNMELALPYTFFGDYIDDSTIDGCKHFDGIPFGIPEVKNFKEGDHIILYTEFGQFTATTLGAIGVQTWPVTLYLSPSAFEFSGYVNVFYQVSDKSFLYEAQSYPLKLEVRRKEYPNSYPYKTILPRPKPEPVNYTSTDLNIGKSLNIIIPTKLDDLLDIFHKGDKISPEIELTGVTSANEGVITRIPVTPLILSAEDVDYNITPEIIFTIPSYKLENIEGSIGTVVYQHDFTDTKGKKQTNISPPHVLSVDTILPYSISIDNQEHVLK